MKNLQYVEAYSQLAPLPGIIPLIATRATSAYSSNPNLTLGSQDIEIVCPVAVHKRRGDSAHDFMLHNTRQDFYRYKTSSVILVKLLFLANEFLSESCKGEPVSN